MNGVWTAFGESLRKGFSPAEILTLSPRAALETAARATAAWIFPLTLLVFLTAAFNSRAIEQALAESGASLQFQKFAPWNRLFFPVFAAGLLAVAAASRWVMLSILDEPERSFSRILAVSAISLLPLLIVLLVSSALGNLLPSGGIQSGRFFFIATLGCLSAALLYEAWTAVRLCRAAFGQNTGRAVLTWGSFYGSLSVACCGGGFLHMLF